MGYETSSYKGKIISIYSIEIHEYLKFLNFIYFFQKFSKNMIIS